MIGKTLGKRYRIEALIGSGGMAVVYRAFDLRARRAVAVKVLREEFSKDHEFLRRFDREAMAAAKTQHHNIVNLLDIGEEGDTRYLVMEYVQGSTLKELIQERGKLHPEEAVRIALAILAALQHAHSKHIVHRDVKPQNMLIDTHGDVKITDFGIARMTDVNTVTVTDGNIMGSVHYFSPEQAKGQQVNHTSDIYSLGVVLYEMLTGRVPFDGDTPVAVAMKHLTELPQPISSISPEVSPAIEQVVAKAMCKSTAQRYASADQMASDLRRALRQPEGGFVKMRPDPGQRTQRTPVKAAAKGKRRMRRVLFFALTAVVFTTALGVIGYTGYTIVGRLMRSVTMPDVVDLDEAMAVARLTRLSLEPVITREYNEAAAGTIVDQQPAEGTPMERGQSVQLRISMGMNVQSVPDLSSMTIDEAELALAAVGLLPGDIVVQISEMPIDRVFQQMPVAGDAIQGGEMVDVYVSGGKVIIPDLTGLTQNEAELKLREMQLKMGAVTLIDSENLKQNKQVQSQHPVVGEAVFPGTEVDLSIIHAVSRPFRANLSIPVKIPAQGAHVRVTLVDFNGREVEQYAAVYAAAGDVTLAVELRSEYDGEMNYRVYIDNTLYLEAKATLKE